MPYISYREFLSEGKNEDMKDASQFDKKFGASFIKSLKFKLNDPSPIDKYIYFSDSTHSQKQDSGNDILISQKNNYRLF